MTYSEFKAKYLGIKCGNTTENMGECVGLVAFAIKKIYNNILCQKELEVFKKVTNTVKRVGKTAEIITGKIILFIEKPIQKKRKNLLENHVGIKISKIMWDVKHYINGLERDCQNQIYVQNVASENHMTFPILDTPIKEILKIGNGYAEVAIVKKIIKLKI